METTAIVGGGASGVLVAAHLVKSVPGDHRILVFEPGPQLGAGVAYSTDHPGHLLNVPAETMSAFDDSPDHFVEWIRSRGLPFGPADFVPRGLYRRYLQDVLHRLPRSGPRGPEIRWVRDQVDDLRLDGAQGRSVYIRSKAGSTYPAHNIVLAVGAPPPSVLESLGLSPKAGVVSNPWETGALENVPAGDVLIVGSGLTMVDVALVLSRRSDVGKIHARSRTGLLPAVHTNSGFAPFPALNLAGATRGRDVVRIVHGALLEAQATGWDWRNVVSAVRTSLPAVWSRLPEDEKVRLLRHLGRTWEVQRHRMSGTVADTFGALVRSGRVALDSGRILSVAPTRSANGQRFRVTIASNRGHEHLEVATLVDCSGPSNDGVQQCSLLDTLIARGTARRHPSGLGLDVDEHGTLLDDSGTPRAQVHTIGWCRRGQCFESTAVPELRVQAERIARRIVAQRCGRTAPTDSRRVESLLSQSAAIPDSVAS